ncbi:HAD-IA family hydrolase [Microbacterium sp.]|uniref:HAD family hydrolase n=1 Tax=Microbacterium sp. TaxID=51671 RepID=UPI001AD5C7F9|nr:HAD-IA family hydrolase [Microbacterium sp.]MBN9152135.1 HAD-IA family hydrolase [Micrococcales bacterium]MBN9155444.1 HAD-IA family hydrolase [Microbacterium sp.]MBN9191874.1 HAD-IA family hydrolase [Microbacterium sp.]MBN9608130.1 HAD-IA family hydrolase [Actinomycetota bacterium]
MSSRPLPIATLNTSDYSTFVETITPINKVLNDAHRNVRTALATGGGADTVGATVDALGMRGLFDVIVTRNDVARGKPAPDIFLAAAQRLDVDPARVLVFEDGDEGLQAADAAGMDAIDVRPLRPTFGVDVTALEGRRTMRPVNPQS